MKRNVRPGDYARALRAAMQDMVVGPGNTTLTTRGLAELTVEDGTPYGYEHLRKLLGGEPVVSRDCNRALCAILNLNEKDMWEIALTEKAIKKFGRFPVRMAGPEDDRMRKIWPKLEEPDREKLIFYAEAMVAQYELASAR